MIEFVRQAAAAKTLDLEAWEDGLVRTALAAGARVLEGLLHRVGCGRQQPALRCGCQRAPLLQSIGQRPKTISTLLGAVRLRRSVFVCPSCGLRRCPADERLGIVQTSFSPAVRRHMARAGSRSSFADAAADLAVYAHLHLAAKDIQRVAEHTGAAVGRWMDAAAEQAVAAETGVSTAGTPLPLLYISFDGTGVPMHAAALAGRRGKQPDGTAKTREVKLGCVFTQIATDENHRPIRQEDSTSYVGAIESSDAFGWRLYGEACRRGLARARQVVVLTDGAAYNRSIVEQHFAGAVHIIDLYHAREHLHELGSLLGYADPARPPVKTWLASLDEGAIEALLAEVKKVLPRTGERRQQALQALDYFARHAEQMRYAAFRQRGWFIGSGVVEAGCRTLIGQRLKHSGMFWSVPGANAIIASRCCQYSQRFADFWEDYAHQLAA